MGDITMVFNKIKRMAPAIMLVPLLFLSGCAMMPAEGYSESSVKVFGSHAAYYNDFTAQSDGDGYLVQGTAHLGTDYDNPIVRMSAEEETTAAVTGLVDCKEGSLRLVYTAPDGTETVLAECEDASLETFDVSLTVTEEESTLKLSGNGEYEVCKFEILIEGDDITFYLGRSGKGGTPKEETIEIPEIPEVPENQEIPEVPDAQEKMEIRPDM